LAVAGEFGSGKLDILLGNGDGTFEAFGFYQVTNSSNGITIADFNGDNKADIAISSGLGDLIVLLGNGDGTFKAPVTYPAPFLVSVAAQDFDGDGMVDLAAGANETPDGIAVFKGNGDGTFQAPRVYSANGGAGGVAVGDFNGDHLPDIVAASAAINSTFTLLNTGVVAFTPTTPLAFPFQLFNTTSAPKSVNLTNNGTTALTITSMTVKGQFGMTSTCGSSVSPGGNCKISVTFSPLSKGMKSGLITINDSASTKPQVIGLTGQGTVAQLSPSSLNFGSQKVGTKSAPQTVTLTNQGTTALSITNISVGGTNAKDFPETNNCPSSLNAGANCTITVTFDPSKTGTRKAQVSITDNGGGSPQTVPLTGTGT
jgi:hypothetical protein